MLKGGFRGRFPGEGTAKGGNGSRAEALALVADRRSWLTRLTKLAHGIYV